MGSVMMAQARKPKLSRQAKTAWDSSGHQWLKSELSELPSSIFHEILLADEYPRRQQLLFDLANMRDDGLEWFWSKWYYRIRPELVADVIRLKNELRHVWKEKRASHVDVTLN